MHRTALISVSSALSQTPAYTARPPGIARCACLRGRLRSPIGENNIEVNITDRWN